MLGIDKRYDRDQCANVFENAKRKRCRLYEREFVRKCCERIERYEHVLSAAAIV